MLHDLTPKKWSEARCAIMIDFKRVFWEQKHFLLLTLKLLQVRNSLFRKIPKLGPKNPLDKNGKWSWSCRGGSIQLCRQLSITFYNYLFDDNTFLKSLKILYAEISSWYVVIVKWILNTLHFKLYTMYKIQASIVRKYPAVFVLLCTHLFFTHSSFVGKVVLTLEYIEEDCFLRGVYESSVATMGNFPHPSLHGKLDYEAAFGSRSSLLQKPICRHKRR